MHKKLCFLLLYFLLLGSSQLSIAKDYIPSIHIQTMGDGISKIVTPASLVIEDHGHFSQSYHIGIRFRGATSLGYVKKSFKIEFWKDEHGEETQNVSLLGMRSDDDWNLDAMYNEPLRLNSISAYDVWRKIHNATDYLPQKAYNGVRMRYTKVFIDSSYAGIYILTERVDRKQLNLSKESGELYKSKTHSPIAGFTKLSPYNNSHPIWEGLHMKYPKDRIDWSPLHEFVSFVIKSDDSQFLSEYSNHLHTSNFLDYFLFINVLALWDNTSKNIYLAKTELYDKYYYVPWDLDGSFGFMWNGTFTTGTKDILSNGVFNRLLKDCYSGGFVDLLQEKWHLLRADFLKADSLMKILMKHHSYLEGNDIYLLEEATWNQYQYRSNYLNEIKSWLNKRISYLDGEFAKLCKHSTGIQNSSNTHKFKLYPNPSSDYLTISLVEESTPYSIKIYSIQGHLVYEGAEIGNHTISVENFSSGLYTVLIETTDARWTKQIVIQNGY